MVHSNTIAQFTNDLKPFALKLTHDLNDADDLVQDTVVKALRYQENYKEGTNLKGWLYTIMRNTFINNYRSQSRRKVIMESVSKMTTKTFTNNAEEQMRIKDLLKEVKKLDKDLRGPIMLLYQGFKYEEIAKKLNVPVGTIKSRVFVARKLMRDRLSVYRMN